MKKSAAAAKTKNPREILADWGIQFSATYIAEVFGNPTGGVRRGTIYTGRLDLGMDVDLEKVIGWTGATFHTNMYQIHGQGLSRDYVGNLMLVSGVEALPATRLYELWIEQSLFDGKLLVKVGQQASDVEFIDSKYDDIFTNSALGWPGITGINLLAGGPSPPLAVPGVRVKAQVSDNITAYAAIFDGDAAPPDSPLDPQLANPHGVLFRVNDPAWMIGQLKYKFDHRREQVAGNDHGRRVDSTSVSSMTCATPSAVSNWPIPQGRANHRSYAAIRASSVSMNRCSRARHQTRTREQRSLSARRLVPPTAT